MKFTLSAAMAAGYLFYCRNGLNSPAILVEARGSMGAVREANVPWEELSVVNSVEPHIPVNQSASVEKHQQRHAAQKRAKRYLILPVKQRSRSPGTLARDCGRLFTALQTAA